MENKMLTKYNIECIELELINKCNLKCPLCVSRNLTSKYKQLEQLNIDKLLSFLDEFNNLKNIHLVGSVSEPLMYKHIFELLTYLYKRNIDILISTNASIKLDWKKLGTLLTPNSEVRFCIDGSTQEIHSKYRINSNLNLILRNFQKFKETSKCITTLQFIEFSYNYNDIDNIINIKQKYQFDKLYKICCDISNNSSFQPIKKIEVANKIREKNLVNNFSKISCFVEEEKFIYINSYGEYLPCCNHYEKYMDAKYLNIYNNTVEEGLNYINEILDDKNNCLVCKKSCNELSLKLENNNKKYMDV